MAAQAEDFTAFTPQLLLFAELERRLDPAEVSEVRQVIGSELVEGNEVGGGAISAPRGPRASTCAAACRSLPPRRAS